MRWIWVKSKDGRVGQVWVDENRDIREQIGADWLWYAIMPEQTKPARPSYLITAVALVLLVILLTVIAYAAGLGIV